MINDTYEKEVYYFKDKLDVLQGSLSKRKTSKLYEQYLGKTPLDSEIRSVKYKYFSGTIHNDNWN